MSYTSRFSQQTRLATDDTKASAETEEVRLRPCFFVLTPHRPHTAMLTPNFAHPRVFV